MAEHGTLMNGAMIRAFRDDRKDQTRRPVRPQPAEHEKLWQALDGRWVVTDEHPSACLASREVRCPFGVPGDRLWFRETWALNRGYAKGIAYRTQHLADTETRQIFVEGPEGIRVELQCPAP